MAKEYESEGLLSDDKNSLARRKHPNCTNERQRWRLSGILSGLLAFSMVINLIQATVRSSSLWPHHDDQKCHRSEFADLRDKEVLVEWLQDSVYSSPNATERDQYWDAINHDSGIVAVPKSWASEKGLPMGSTFPWDADKTIYFVNAYHGLHCVKNIYHSFMEYRLGIEQSLPAHHIIHCLDQIRADILCAADDTLRVTTPDMRPVTGEGQLRKCKNWDALKAWTYANAGCYRYGDPNVEDQKESQIPRMRYCREGNPDLETVREYFGKGQGWRPADDHVWSWFDDGNKYIYDLI
ncbi:hypothetical protein NHQ30_005739 [Ciborinia camelliae]|nr:hypothetical protein NHQ30_005739 [Ciborinia camelliae]